MDIQQLLTKVLSRMKENRNTFDSSNNLEQKKKAYNEFVDGITSLNKILKGGAFGEGSKGKIREILKNSIQTAGEMKSQLSNMKSGNSNNNTGRGTNMSGGRGTNLSNNNSSKWVYS
jgi:hypothetical protein